MTKNLKATKLEVLRFIERMEAVGFIDLMNEFGYTYRSAVKRIQRLEKANLVEKLGLRVGAYCLTNEATRRLAYYDNKGK